MSLPQLWHKFNPWPGNLHMLQLQLGRRERERERERERIVSENSHRQKKLPRVFGCMERCQFPVPKIVEFGVSLIMVESAMGKNVQSELIVLSGSPPVKSISVNLKVKVCGPGTEKKLRRRKLICSVITQLVANLPSHLGKQSCVLRQVLSQVNY